MEEVSFVIAFYWIKVACSIDPRFRILQQHISNNILIEFGAWKVPIKAIVFFTRLASNGWRKDGNCIWNQTMPNGKENNKMQRLNWPPQRRHQIESNFRLTISSAYRHEWWTALQAVNDRHAAVWETERPVCMWVYRVLQSATIAHSSVSTSAFSLIYFWTLMPLKTQHQRKHHLINTHILILKLATHTHAQFCSSLFYWKSVRRGKSRK